MDSRLRVDSLSSLVFSWADSLPPSSMSYTGSPPPMGALQIRWDPKNLEIRTKSVEKTLEPLVTQVSPFFPAALLWLTFVYVYLYLLYLTLIKIVSLSKCGSKVCVKNNSFIFDVVYSSFSYYQDILYSIYANIVILMIWLKRSGSSPILVSVF